MTTATQTTTPTLAQKFSAMLAELDQELYERHDALLATVLGLLSEQHVFLFGVPGTAKSEIARRIVSRIDGARKFEYLFTKTSSPDDVFGALDVSKEDHSNGVEKTRYRVERDTTGGMADAHVVFADEIFKSNAAILNGLLALLNERVYHTGNRVINAPLRTMISASNETPDDASLAALYDRLALRVKVDYIQNDDAFIAMLTNGAQPTSNPTTITLAELDQAIADVQATNVPQGVLKTMARLRREVQDGGLVVSDRKWRQILRIVQAHAWLAGRATVEDQDLAIVRFCLWETPAQIEQAAELARKYGRSILDYLIDARVDAEKQYRETADLLARQNEQDQITSLINLKKEIKKIERFMGQKGKQASQNGASPETLDQLRNEVRKVQAMLAKIDQLMGVDESNGEF